MSKFNDIYFLWFSRFVKFWGYCALIIGSIMVLMNATWVYIADKPISVNGMETSDNVYKAIYVLVPLVVAILGWFIIKAKPINKKNNPDFFNAFEKPERAKQPWEE